MDFVGFLFHSSAQATWSLPEHIRDSKSSALDKTGKVQYGSTHSFFSSTKTMPLQKKDTELPKKAQSNFIKLLRLKKNKKDKRTLLLKLKKKKAWLSRSWKKVTNLVFNQFGLFT
jgi:hypothetical protein